MANNGANTCFDVISCALAENSVCLYYENVENVIIHSSHTFSFLVKLSLYMHKRHGLYFEKNERKTIFIAKAVLQLCRTAVYSVVCYLWQITNTLQKGTLLCRLGISLKCE